MPNKQALDSPVVKRFAINALGRDFVIGDVHGAYDSIWQAMRLAKFDRRVDRLFSVGDLIDRGPGSSRAREFLAQPYVHAIAGNHERDFAGLNLESLRLLASMNWNGMGWIKDAADETLVALQDAFKALPLAIEIETPRGTVGLVHAEVPIGMDWPTFIQRLEAQDPDVVASALEGRERLQTRNDTGVNGVGRLFVGHTIQWNGVRKLGNVFAIDTGAIFHELGKEEGALTLSNIVCRTGLLANHAASACHPVVGADDEWSSNEPFGAYASPTP